MRLYKIARADVEMVVASSSRVDEDDSRNRRIHGLDNRGRAIIVVIADDDPYFVITAFPDD